jgi:ribonucleoside-diphosphate reductase alpha chain
MRTAMRMLDNVIDINYYAVDKARNSNLRHRPVGMGIMGFQDCLHKLRVAYASRRRSSSPTARWRWCPTAPTGPRPSWPRSAAATDLHGLAVGSRHPAAGHARPARRRARRLRRAGPLVDARLGAAARAHQQHGMRNSNCIAIAPTATIANIIGVSASIEPTYQNLYVKSNLSGEFTVVNEYLVADLKARGLWDEVMISDLKYFDGNLARIDRVPAELRRLYATAFEIEPKWLVEAGARRQKWIDQSQSLNIYMAAPRARSWTKPTSSPGCAA